MSHDELSEGSPVSEVQASANAEPIREASELDAPPVKTSRRRRSEATGTAAASTSSTETPRRSTRRPKAVITQDPLIEASITESVPEPEPPASAPPKPERRRRTAPKATPPSLEEGAETTPAPTSSTRPSRRSKVQAISLPVIETTEPEEAEVTSTEADAVPLAPIEPIEPPPARPSRRRSSRSRGRQAPEAVTEEAPFVEEEPSLETQPEGTPPAEEVSSPSPSSRRRRRRGPRPGVFGQPPIEAPAPTEVKPIAAEPVGEETTEESEEDSSLLGDKRPRRNRRRNRSKTGNKWAAAEEEPVEIEVLAEPVVARIAVPVIEEIPPIDTTVGAHLLFRNGVPEIRINNIVTPPILFFGNLDDANSRPKVLSEVRRAARSGVHIHSTLIELPCPLIEDSSMLDDFDNRVRALLEADPQGYILPRIAILPAKGWRREYPHDMANYEGEPSGDPSLTSDRFWKEVERSLLTLIEHVSAQSWGGRICGYHLERAEWFQPVDQGYDRSTANRDAFRDWLRTKYQDNIVGLRSAWHDGSVQFHTADIPPTFTKSNAIRTFFETRRERRYIDFYEFTSDSTALRITSLARVIKKATYYQSLVSVCYGYTLEFGHGYSGHLALGQLLQSPHIDILCGPPSYRDRKPGGAASFPAPVHSILLHKKLWLSEDDTKTYLASAQSQQDDYNPRLNDRFSTEQAHQRAMGKSLTLNTGIGWMDLWGEGWLDEEALWEKIGNFADYFHNSLHKQKSVTAPDVIAIIDEKSLLHIQKGESHLRLFTNGVRDLLQCAGVSYGIYLQEDVTHADFPTDSKLYLFLTPYRLTTPQRAAIKEKLHGGDKTLVWLNAPNSCEERPTIGSGLEESVADTIGITLRQQEWNSEVGSRIINPHHVLTERITNREFGTRERLNPSYHVEDTNAQVLAEYQGSGLTSLAVRDLGTWRSIFVGEPTLNTELLRGICHYAGVHCWVPVGDDIFFVGNGWMMIHAVKDGQRSVRFPSPTSLYDLTDKRIVATDTREYRFYLRMGNTRLFCLGSAERFRDLGLPSSDPRENERPQPVERVPVPPPAPIAERLFVTEEIPITPVPIEAVPVVSQADRQNDIETLQAILNMASVELDADAPASLDDMELTWEFKSTPGTPTEAADGAQSLADMEEILNFNRRRRRRGGRGRGHRRPGEEGTPTGGE